MKILGLTFGSSDGAQMADYRGQIDAINKAQAVIEFSLDGTILNANNNFLATLGYSLAEIKGQHHSMFVESSYRQSAEYRLFWEKLGRGEYDAAQYKRLGKNGKEVWIQASYNPIFDINGKPFKVVKYATDITDQKKRNADVEGQLAAIDKAQAIIEFSLDGTIHNANANFLATLGYSIDEIKGKHHSMFVEPAYRQSAEYRLFWEKLGRGEYDSGRYLRLGKGGKEVWIQASYNPIFDLNGKPFKVVKYATDVTDQVNASRALELAVEETQGAVNAASDRDLTRRIPLAGKTGQIAELCSGVNGLLDTMSSVVTEVKSASREIANASGEITTATTDLSQRTEEQAASLEETSSSMEQISATVKKNAENARQASESASGTSDVANKGGEIVAQAVIAMSGIEESSRKVADIIGVIDEIARQTNLLALNAAVEAARAGDAGRGFAVVASEVRSLAQRSSQAAKDIKDLITRSSDQVKEGVVLVNRAGQSLQDITASIRGVATLMADIATASVEQASGVEQINKALTQMDEVTQQNSALVEENAATAKNLEQQATMMADRVNSFQLASSARDSVIASDRKSPSHAPSVSRKEHAKSSRNVVGQMHSKLSKAVGSDWKEF